MYGYGCEDISPVRAETSLNESYSTRRDSSSISEFLSSPIHLDMENTIGHITHMSPGKNFMDNISIRNKVNGSKEQMTYNLPKIRDENKYMSTVQKDFMVPYNYEEVFANNFEKNFTMEIDIPENKFPCVSKRSRSSSLSGKDSQDMMFNPKTTNSVSKCKQAKYHYEGSQHYMHLRSDSQRNREQTVDKFNVNKSHCNTNNLLICVEKKPVEVIDLEVEVCDSTSNKTESFLVNKNNATHNCSEAATEDCTIAAVLPSERRNVYDCSKESSSTLAVRNHPNQSQQVQANIIEKLIKDTVSFEFDAIRQLLYLQHLSLLRHLHKTLEVFENHNNSNTEFMLKVIEELMQENRQLRNAVIAHQRFT